MTTERTWTVQAVLGAAREYLERNGVAEARAAAEILFAHILSCRRLDLYLRHDSPVSAHDRARYKALLQERAKGRPVQYLTGEAGFRQLVLGVRPGVLIPRPETEVLVGELLRAAAARRAAWGLPADGRVDCLDLGTGSGAIALSLAQELPGAAVVATDVSSEALEVAAENARRAGLAPRVEFRQGPFFAPLKEGERFHLIACNPPYLAATEVDSLPKEVREHEPWMALVSGETGLEATREVIAGARERLVPGGLLGLEVALGRAQDVVKLLQAAGAYRLAGIHRDLAGQERCVLAWVEGPGGGRAG